MLVKKINPEWQPAENRGLEVGEVIEITDPRQIVKQGLGVVVAEDGRELSSFELYGELTGDEATEFKQWQQMKRAKETSEKLVKESEKLVAQKTEKSVKVKAVEKKTNAKKKK